MEETVVEPVEVGEFQSGLTKRAVAAILYSIVVFTPALLYLSLLGVGGGLSISWFVLILVVELMKFSGHKLSQQESFMIYMLAGIEMIPLWAIYVVYFRNSPILELFVMPNGRPLSTQIPDWWAPPPESGVWEARTLFHPAWATPIALNIISTFAGVAGVIALGIFAREIFIEVEDLPFPLQVVGAEAIMVLSIGKKRDSQTLALFTMAGFGWGFILYAIPLLAGAMGKSLTIIPIPWVDLTGYIQDLMPGASLGVATDLAGIAMAFVLPPTVTWGFIIGSFVHFVVGNWLVVNYGLSPVAWWTKGMNIQQILLRSTLYFWVSPLIGIMLAAGLMPIFLHPRRLISAFRLMTMKTTAMKRRLDPISLKWGFLVPFIIFIATSIGFFVVLAPSFLTGLGVLVIPMIIIFPLVLTLIQTRMIGVTGVSASLPYFGNLFYIATGYQNADIWFVPNQMLASGAGWVSNFKIAELVRCKATSYIKIYLLMLPIAIFVGYIFTELFWKLAPIPSARYPGAAIFWPIDVITSATWITRPPGIFDPVHIAGGFGITTAIAVAFELLKVPFPLIAIATGFSTTTPLAVTLIIGFIIRFLFLRLFGKTWFDANKMTMSAGLLMGQGVAAVIGVAVALITNSIWPYAY